MPFFVAITIEDAGGADGPDLTTCRVYLPDTLAIDKLTEIAGDLATAVAALITGKIRTVQFGVEIDLLALSLPSAAELLSDVQERARFAFRTNTGYASSMSIGTFDEDLINIDGTVDTTDIDVVTFVNMLQDGWTLGDGTTLVEPTDYRGDDLFSLEAAHQAWGKNR